MTAFDGIIVGGGHNGLICAAYLARAGLKLAVVERNREMGGGCITEEVTLPGFKHNLHSNYHYFEEGPVARDLQLEHYGLKYIYPEVQHAMVFRDGTAVCIHRDPYKTAASFARFSKHDADSYLELYDKFAVKTRELVNQMLYSRPLPPAELANRVKGPLGEELLSYGRLTLYEAVDRNFEEERIRCILKIFLHAISLDNLPNLGSFFPRLLSRLTHLGFVVGGSAGLPRALGRIIEECGGSLITGKHVEGIEVKEGQATGVRFADGEVLEAKQFVASAVDAPQTLRMVGEEHFDEEINRKIKNYQWAEHSLVTLHLALNEPQTIPLLSSTPMSTEPSISCLGLIPAKTSRTENSQEGLSATDAVTPASRTPCWHRRGSIRPSGGPLRRTPYAMAEPRHGISASWSLQNGC